MGGHVKDMYCLPIFSPRCCLYNIIELSFAFALVRAAKRSHLIAPDLYQYRCAKVALFRMSRYIYSIVVLQRNLRTNKVGNRDDGN